MKVPTARWFTALVVAALLGGTLLGAWGSVRNGLGTSANECYVDLPVAATAVHGAGHLDGVRLLSVSALRSMRTGRLYRAAGALRPVPGKVCLIAYSGTFEAGKVSRSLGDQLGHVAIVAVTYPGRRLVGTLIVRRSPLQFGRSHLALATVTTDPPGRPDASSTTTGTGAAVGGAPRSSGT